MSILLYYYSSSYIGIPVSGSIPLYILPLPVFDFPPPSSNEVCALAIDVAYGDKSSALKATLSGSFFKVVSKPPDQVLLYIFIALMLGSYS
jgi:hypothetical protein